MTGHPADILNQIAALRGDYALVIVTDISGGTLRAKGTLMAVTQTETFGYVSAGCVDGDIIVQARQAIADGRTRDLVYGAGSPFKDIELPCGGTIELKVIPNPDQEEIARAIRMLNERSKASLNLEGVSVDLMPKLRIRLVGRGAPFTALANLAGASGFEVIGQSPDQDLLTEGFVATDHLTDPENIPAVKDDAYTAVVFLFHDHDWEPALLEQALSGPAFYIGAMGSEKTQALRLQTLVERGVKDTGKLRGPIGLVPAMRDAQHLSVSILAEVIQAAQFS